MKIVLCICTFRRPEELRKLLQTLPAIQGAEDLEIVVADNDSAGDGLAVCAELAKGNYPFPLHRVPCTDQSGISAARNAACLKALTLSPDRIAFLDDDDPSHNG